MFNYSGIFKRYSVGVWTVGGIVWACLSHWRYHWLANANPQQRDGHPSVNRNYCRWNWQDHACTRNPNIETSHQSWFILLNNLRCGHTKQSPPYAYSHEHLLLLQADSSDDPNLISIRKFDWYSCTTLWWWVFLIHKLEQIVLVAVVETWKCHIWHDILPCEAEKLYCEEIDLGEEKPRQVRDR